MNTTKRPFTGKVAWVTGSSRGIGRAIANHLASLGASVTLHGTTATSTRSFNEGDSLEAVARAIAGEHQVEVLPVHGDLSEEGVVKTLAKQIRSTFGRIDILVNSAGGDIGAQGTGSPTGGKPPHNDAVFISMEDLHAVFNRNLMTCILTCREVAPEMMERRAGQIVNIGSTDGLVGVEKTAIYATAKAAVHEYTRCLALLLRPYNVRANAIAPGDIVTPRWSATRPTDSSLMVTDGTLVRYGRPIEIAHVVEFLVSEASSWVSGQVIRVDGGLQCWPA
jgi:3-oxoacyl-[acyl-carrier protein] reductase